MCLITVNASAVESSRYLAFPGGSTIPLTKLIQCLLHEASRQLESRISSRIFLSSRISVLQLKIVGEMAKIGVLGRTSRCWLGVTDVYMVNLVA